MIPNKTPGKLRVYLGYATGCGKSFALLRDALFAHQRGKKISIATLNHDTRPGILDLAKQLPRTEHKSLSDLENSSATTLIIDELGGLQPESQLENIIHLLQRGKNIWTTLNVQHLDSVAERLDSAIHVHIKSRVPDSILNLAESVVFVDTCIDDLRARFEAGQIFPKDKAEQALAHFFTHENLVLLRKIALEEVVESQLKSIENEKILSAGALSEADPSVLVVITDEEKYSEFFLKMIHQGAKLASHYSCHFQVALVTPKKIIKRKSTATNWIAPLEKLALELGGSFLSLKGKSVINDIVRFTTENHVRHLVFAKPHLKSLLAPVSESLQGIHIHLIDKPLPSKNI